MHIILHYYIDELWTAKTNSVSRCVRCEFVIVLYFITRLFLVLYRLDDWKMDSCFWIYADWNVNLHRYQTFVENCVQFLSFKHTQLIFQQYVISYHALYLSNTFIPIIYTYMATIKFLKFCYNRTTWITNLTRWWTI